jgi:hypothetical protein
VIANAEVTTVPPTTGVPEPSALILAGLSAMGLVGYRLRRRVSRRSSNGSQ